jgi:transposase
MRRWRIVLLRITPLREIRKVMAKVLGCLSGQLDKLYSTSDRPAVAPECVLRALPLRAFSVRSERQLVEQLDYNLSSRGQRESPE